MVRYLRDGRRTSVPNPRQFGRIEKVSTVGFCESMGCARLADWRIGYGVQSVDLCSRHTLATMKSRRIWSGRY